MTIIYENIQARKIITVSIGRIASILPMSSRGGAFGRHAKVTFVTTEFHCDCSTTSGLIQLIMHVGETS